MLTMPTDASRRQPDDIGLATPSAQTAAFAADVRRGLSCRPRQLQPRYFYDALGSALFDAICRLPWYPITRAETRLIDRHASTVFSHVGRPARLIELGCGSGDKLARLVRPWVTDANGHHDDRSAVNIHLVDVSEAALAHTRQRLETLGRVPIIAHQASYEDGLARATRDRAEGEATLVVFLGSNIGNFDPAAALELLANVQRTLRPGDALLLGADLVKPEPELLLAYDDPLGVTAAFNKNLLVRINRELGGTFDLAAFDHRAVWNAAASRVEMHLVSRTRQSVRIAGADCEIDFDAGESIWTESSYKFERASLVALGTAAGLTPGEMWVDPEARFALTLFEKPRRGAVPFRGR